MKDSAAAEASWILTELGKADIDELMRWFPDAYSVDIWGGPKFRFPFTPASFREDCQLEKMASYCLRDSSGAMAAFGQYYNRHGRAHLARLIADPARRRQGAGKALILHIIEVAARSGEYSEASLFVYRNNAPAYRCYRSLGFEVQDYPHDAEMKDRCYFLTRPVDVEPA